MPYHDLIGTEYVQDLNTDYLFQDVALVSQGVMGPSHVTNLADKAIRAALTHRGVGHLAILVGAGARGAGDEVEQAAEKLGAPVIQALLGKEVIPDDSPYTTGGAGLVGTRPSHMALKACDALLIKVVVLKNNVLGLIK